MIVACVYKTSPQNLFCREDVQKLLEGVSRNLKMPHTMVCITDDRSLCSGDLRVHHVPGSHLPGWWIKMELFRPLRFPKGETILYIDLDTVICGHLDDMVNVGMAELRQHNADIIMLRDTRYPELAGGGVLLWTAGNPSLERMFAIYERSPEAAQIAYSGIGALGDQGMISEYAEIIRCWQDFLPERALINLSTGDPRGPETCMAYCSFHPKLPALLAAGHPLVTEHWVCGT